MEEPAWLLANEFAEVEVSLARTGNGVRLRIRDRRSGRAVELCPLELESLTWQPPETFSAFLATPFGPAGQLDEGQPGGRQLAAGQPDGSQPDGGTA
jgi:hypothetical protein